VRLSLSTHDAGGITTKDFELARAISQIELWTNRSVKKKICVHLRNLAIRFPPRHLLNPLKKSLKMASPQRHVIPAQAGIPDLL